MPINMKDRFRRNIGRRIRSPEKSSAEERKRRRRISIYRENPKTGIGFERIHRERPVIDLTSFEIEGRIAISYHDRSLDCEGLQQLEPAIGATSRIPESGE